MFKSYDGVLKMDGKVGNKKIDNPHEYFAPAETTMVERVKQTVNKLPASAKTSFAL